jgi:hypothetical protein
VVSERLCGVYAIEDAVHRVGALQEHGADLLAVDRLCDCRAASMAHQALAVLHTA